MSLTWKFAEHEGLFRALVENSSDGVFLIDRKGEIIYASPSSIRLLGFRVDQHLHQLIAWQYAGIEMYLQRTDARRQVQNAFHPTVIAGIPRLFNEPLHQGMRAEAQIEIKLERAILDQQILVACLAIYNLHLTAALRDKVEDRGGFGGCVLLCLQ